MTRALPLLACVVVLAGLDLAGALLAQQYAERRVVLPLVLGALTFVLLFVVYAFSLRYAQLSVVTMGWIVLLQVALVAVDLGRARLHLDRPQAAAVVLVLVLQCYLVVSTAPADDPEPGAAGLPPAAVPAPRAATALEQLPDGDGDPARAGQQPA